MSYDGYLLRVGGYDITGENIIAAESYKATMNIQDLDSYRDANGELHRNALDHVPMKVEITTRENITNEDMAPFMSNIRSNFSTTKERKCSVTAYIPELDDYETQECYMPDPEFNIKTIKDGVIKYKPVTIKFIGY